MEKLKTYIGALAVEKGYLSQAQLDGCIAALDQEESEKTIDQALLEKGYLTQEQIKQLQKKRLLNIEKIKDPVFVDYMLKMKIVSPEKIAQCQELQAKAQREQKTFIPIGTFLIAHGAMSEAKYEELLKCKEIRRVVQETVWRDDPRRTGLIGRVLSGYEIVSKIAAGGMGVVYRANQIELDRIIALKILFDKFASDKKHLNQFFREARLSAMLNHPNLVHLFDLGRDQGFNYYAMELVEGTNLGDYLKEKEKLQQEEALDLIIQAGMGLEHIHSFEILHRDIKPSNFIVRPDGLLKIMDLGLACPISKLPRKPATIGTPYYMSSELLYAPDQVDQRADIYALGVSFYRMLANQFPIGGNDAKEIMANIKDKTPTPVQQYVPEVSSEIVRVIHKMIAKDVKERYQNMSEVLNDLDRILL